MTTTITDARCSICRDYLWSVDRGAGALVGCPSCDRPRCRRCRDPFGRLFSPDRPRATRLDQADDVCDLCVEATR